MQTATELIVVRHGETEWNRELRFQGHADVGLNAMGHEQALRIATRVGLEKPACVVSSDLLRAQQTATQIAVQTQLPLVLDAAWRGQHFGVVDGMTPAEIERLHPLQWREWLEFRQDHAMPGGESRRVFHTRIVDALHRAVLEHCGQRVVIVTHGDVLDMLWRTARGSSLDGMRECRIPNAGFNRVRIFDGAAAVSVELLNWAETDHLAGLPEQPVYDQRRHFDGSIQQ